MLLQKKIANSLKFSTLCASTKEVAENSILGTYAEVVTLINRHVKLKTRHGQHIVFKKSKCCLQADKTLPYFFRIQNTSYKLKET
jgi:hypothetical protein